MINFSPFFIHRAVSRGKYNIAKSRKSRKDGITWQLLARLDNRLLVYKEKRTSYLGLFVCAVRFNLDLANVCNSKLTKKTMKNNCRVRNESSSSLFDFLDLFLIEVTFSCFSSVPSKNEIHTMNNIYLFHQRQGNTCALLSLCMVWLSN